VEAAGIEPASRQATNSQIGWGLWTEADEATSICVGSCRSRYKRLRQVPEKTPGANAYVANRRTRDKAWHGSYRRRIQGGGRPIATRIARAERRGESQVEIESSLTTGQYGSRDTLLPEEGLCRFLFSQS
jgi:hypothetical protein